MVSIFPPDCQYWASRPGVRNRVYFPPWIFNGGRPRANNEQLLFFLKFYYNVLVVRERYDQRYWWGRRKMYRDLKLDENGLESFSINSNKTKCGPWSRKNKMGPSVWELPYPIERHTGKNNVAL